MPTPPDMTTVKKWRAFQFAVPPLPKEWYLKLEELRAFYDLSQWQVVILALACMCQLGAENRDQLDAMATMIRNTYPPVPRGKKGPQISTPPTE